jgi:hypothetical protein
VWTFGHSVREIERTHQQVIVEETATTGAVVLFGGFAFLALIAFRNANGNLRAIGLAITVFLASIAAYAAVGSTFTADRSRRALVVKRRIGVLTYEKVYEARDIDSVFVHRTINGSGLSLRFQSGRTKGLTMSLGFGDSVDGLAAALNHFLHVPHRG